jgi:hypothetical protein
VTVREIAMVLLKDKKNAPFRRKISTFARLKAKKERKLNETDSHSASALS